MTQTHAFSEAISRHAAMSLYQIEAFDYAIQIGQQLFKKYKTPRDAYNIACNYARMSEPDTAIRWLEAAIEAGYEDLDKMRTDEDLVLLRSHPTFQKWVDRG